MVGRETEKIPNGEKFKITNVFLSPRWRAIICNQQCVPKSSVTPSIYIFFRGKSIYLNAVSSTIFEKIPI